MKTKSLIFLCIAFLQLISCGSNEKKGDYLTMDAYNFFSICENRPDWIYNNIQEISYGGSTFYNTWGFRFQGWRTCLNPECRVGVWLKDCDYDMQSKEVTNINEKSQVLWGLFYNNDRSKCLQLTQFVFSESEAQKIREQLTGETRRCTKQIKEEITYINSYLSIEEEHDEEDEGFFEKPAISFTTSIDENEDYPFIRSKGVAEVYGLVQNEVSFLEDYSSRRIKVSGNLTQIKKYSDCVSYRLEDGDEIHDLYINVKREEEAYTNFSLPRKISISGFVTDVSSNYITLKLVRIYDYSQDCYLGVTPVDPLYLRYPSRNNRYDFDE